MSSPPAKGGLIYVTASGSVGEPPPQELPRPEKATRAGALVITLGAIGLLAWGLILLLALAISAAFSDTGDFGVPWGSYTAFFLFASLIAGFWAMEILCGVLVLRGRARVRVPAIVVTSLALAGSLAALLAGPPVPWSVGIGLYAAATFWSVALLMSREVGTWCRRA
jgi:hypothetical protein